MIEWNLLTVIQKRVFRNFDENKVIYKSRKKLLHIKIRFLLNKTQKYLSNKDMPQNVS